MSFLKNLFSRLSQPKPKNKLEVIVRYDGEELEFASFIPDGRIDLIADFLFMLESKDIFDGLTAEFTKTMTDEQKEKLISELSNKMDNYIANSLLSLDLDKPIVKPSQVFGVKDDFDDR